MWITSILSYITHSSLIVSFMTLDGLFNTCGFIKSYLTGTPADKLVRSSVYQHSFIDKFIYYSLTQLFYTSSRILLWQDNNVLVYGLLCTALPPILNRLLSTYTFNLIRQRKEMLIKLTMTKQISNVIMLCSNTYLHKSVVLTEKDHTMIYELLNRYNSELILEQIGSVIKNALVIGLLSYVKTYSIYYKPLKMLYKYQTGEMIHSFNDRTAKLLLSNLIDRRQWKDLLKPSVFKAMIYLIQHGDESTFIADCILLFKYAFGKMFVVWTLSSFFKSVWVVPIVSLVFYKDLTLQYIGVQGITILTCILSSNYLLISFIAQFGENILWNRVSFAVYRFIQADLMYRGTALLRINEKYTKRTVIIFFYTLALKLLDPSIGLLILHTGVTCLQPYPEVLLYIIPVATGWKTAYNPLQMLHNIILVYICLALYAIYTQEFWGVYNWCKQQVVEMTKKKRDIMDIDQFPSVSDKQRINKLPQIHISGDHPANKQEVVAIIDAVFDLPEDKFMDEISHDSYHPQLPQPQRGCISSTDVKENYW